MTSPINSTSGTSSTPTTPAASTSTTSADSMSQTFLKMLVAQMKNQDPLNPMNNAEVTTQMAQINTVSGINRLNTTMSGMNTGFAQMQLLQGVSLVGHQVLVQGDGLSVNNGSASAGYTLDNSADTVKVNVYSSTGSLVDTINEGAQSSGQHSFTWTPSSSMPTTGVTFKVVATNSGSAVNATPMVTDTVSSVSTSNSTLMLNLQNNGSVAYTSVQAFH